MAVDNTRKSYTSGHFELQIDGKPTTAYLKSVDGGWGKHALIDERIGPENKTIKHASVWEVDPFSFEFGMSGANEVLSWIKASWDKDPTRRDGQITHANFNMEAMLVHEFSGALITETTFPECTGGSNQPAYMKCKVQPYATSISPGGKQKLKPHMTSKQKSWLSNGFKLSLDGIEEMRYTNKIDSFTVKQNVKRMYTGKFRQPEIVPTKIEFPNISGTISVEYASGLLDWYKKYVQAGQDDPSAQKSGSIEYLAPNKKDVLFRVNLYEVGLLHVGMLASTANADQIKRVKFELYVGRMEIDTGASGFQ